MINRTVAIVMAAAILAACAARADETAAASQSASAATAPAPKANLYILRVHAEPIAVGATLSVDGVKVVEIVHRHYTALYVPPGDHIINYDWPWWSSQREGKIDLAIREGATHYLEITGISRVTGWVNSSAAIVTMGSGVSEIDPDSARQALKDCCKYQAPRVADLSQPPGGQ